MLDQIIQSTEIQSTTDLKSCCAAVYESDWAHILLGDSFHPGGLALTQQLGTLINLRPGHKVLDVASGKGTSAIFLAENFGVDVVGIDYGRSSVETANNSAVEAGLSGQVHFEVGDAEQLPFAENSFDALLCECAFCTFPDKKGAASEFKRVLKPNGRLGFSDLTRTGKLPPELDTLLAWVSCIAAAQPLESYIDLLKSAGLIIEKIENHDQALLQTVAGFKGKLLGIELLIKLNKIELPGTDFDQAKSFIRKIYDVIRQGKLGYSIITASNPP